MDIVYKPGKENVIADWVSRAITMNAVQEDREPSRDVRQFLRKWIP